MFFFHGDIFYWSQQEKYVFDRNLLNLAHSNIRCNTCHREFWPTNGLVARNPWKWHEGAGGASAQTKPSWHQLVAAMRTGSLESAPGRSKERHRIWKTMAELRSWRGGDEEALDHPMKPYALQQRKTQQQNNGGHGTGWSGRCRRESQAVVAAHASVGGGREVS